VMSYAARYSGNAREGKITPASNSVNSSKFGLANGTLADQQREARELGNGVGYGFMLSKMSPITELTCLTILKVTRVLRAANKLVSAARAVMRGRR